MARLTEKIPSDGYYDEIYAGSFRNICNLGNNKCTSMVHDKLGQHEDIEEELGIDLIILLKALKNGAYFISKYRKSKIIHKDYLVNNLDLEFKRFDIRMSCFVDAFEYSTGGCFYDFKDYGKTWALTKEELEK